MNIFRFDVYLSILAVEKTETQILRLYANRIFRILKIEMIEECEIIEDSDLEYLKENSSKKWIKVIEEIIMTEVSYHKDVISLINVNLIMSELLPTDV